MGKQVNLGALGTTLKGCVLEAFRFTIGVSGAPTLVDNGRSGAVASVVRNSAGLYTITLEKPYWAKLVSCIPELSCVNGAGSILEARYVEGSYSASAGTFQIVCTLDEDAPAAADSPSGTGMDVILVFQRLTNI